MPLSKAKRQTSPIALLVDRDDDTRTLYSEYLKRAHCNTHEAADGRDALAKAIALRPDVIVTETRLPGIDGFELCEILRRDTVTRAIPIIVVTADAFPTSVERAREAGADAVLIKPCLPDVLFEKIQRLIDRSHNLHIRSEEMPAKSGEQVSESQNLEQKSDIQRQFLSHQHARVQTTSPPVRAPELICPLCDRTLLYRHSNVGGVSAHYNEQWDYYECVAGCGTFQYRHRTRRLRKI